MCSHGYFETLLDLSCAVLVPSGVDIELPGVQRRVDLRRRVLTPRECDSLGNVAGVTEQEEVLLRFSVKEAVYKAVHPFLHRPLGFKDVSALSPFFFSQPIIFQAAAWHYRIGYAAVAEILWENLFIPWDHGICWGKC